MLATTGEKSDGLRKGIPVASSDRDAYRILHEWAERSARELDPEAKVELRPLRLDKAGVLQGHISVWSLGHKRISHRIRLKAGCIGLGDATLSLSLPRACYELGWLVRFALKTRPRSRRLT